MVVGGSSKGGEEARGRELHLDAAQRAAHPNAICSHKSSPFPQLEGPASWEEVRTASINPMKGFELPKPNGTPENILPPPAPPPRR